MEMKLEAEKAEKAAERALRQEAFWFEAATLLSGVWEKSSQSGERVTALSGVCVGVCVMCLSVQTLHTTVFVSGGCSVYVGLRLTLQSIHRVVRLFLFKKNAEGLYIIIQVLLDSSAGIHKYCPVNNPYTMLRCDRCFQTSFQFICFHAQFKFAHENQLEMLEIRIGINHVSVINHCYIKYTEKVP